MQPGGGVERHDRPAGGNNTSQSCGAARTQADLSVAQSATTTGKPGKGTATFAVAVTNTGPSDSGNVVLRVTSSLFTAPAPSTVTTHGGSCSVAAQTVTCTWVRVPVGTTEQVSLSVPWRSSVGSVCATTTVSAGTPDPNAVNNNGNACVGKK